MLDHSSYMDVQNAKLDLFPLMTTSAKNQEPLVFGIYSRIPSRSIELPLYNRLIAGKIAVDLYGLEKCHWKLLKTRYANINSQILSCTAISESTLLMFLNTRNEGMGYRLKLISINLDTVPNSFLRVFAGHGQRRMNIPERLQRLCEFSLLNLTNDSIVLILSLIHI